MTARDPGSQTVGDRQSPVGSPSGPGAGSDPGLVPTARGVLTSPGTTFGAIAHRQPIGQAFAVVVLAFALSYLVQGLAVTADPDAALGEALVTALGGLLFGVPAGLVFFLLWTVGVLLMSKLLGGSGDFRGTLCGLGFAYLPLAIGAVVATLALPFGTAAGEIIAVLLITATLWSLTLDVFAVREIHGVSTGRAVGAVLLTMVLFSVLSAGLLFGVLAAA